MRIAKGAKSLVMSGKWSIGWISPNKVLYVTRLTNEHDMFLKSIVGNTKWYRDYAYDAAGPYYDGWVRLINGTVRKDFDKWVLGVDVDKDYYEDVKNEIINFIPFYRYFHTLYIDIYSKSGWKHKVEKLQDIGQSDVLFSVNPRR